MVHFRLRWCWLVVAFGLAPMVSHAQSSAFLQQQQWQQQQRQMEMQRRQQMEMQRQQQQRQQQMMQQRQMQQRQMQQQQMQRQMQQRQTQFQRYQAPQQRPRVFQGGQQSGRQGFQLFQRPGQQAQRSQAFQRRQQPANQNGFRIFQRPQSATLRQHPSSPRFQPANPNRFSIFRNPRQAPAVAPWRRRANDQSAAARRRDVFNARGGVTTSSLRQNTGWRGPVNNRLADARRWLGRVTNRTPTNAVTASAGGSRVVQGQRNANRVVGFRPPAAGGGSGNGGGGRPPYTRGLAANDNNKTGRRGANGSTSGAPGAVAVRRGQGLGGRPPVPPQGPANDNVRPAHLAHAVTGKWRSIPASQLNAELSWRYDKPFKANTKAYVVETRNPEEFVRLFGGKSRAEGRFIARKKDIAGLTPAQIKEKFALPAVPTKMTAVTAPPKTMLYVGTAGEQEKWGPGGGVQYYLPKKVEDVLFSKSARSLAPDKPID